MIGPDLWQPPQLSDLFVGRERRMLYRGDSGLPLGVPPAAPLFQSILRQGETTDMAFRTCHSRVQIFHMEEILGGDAPLWQYLDECTERSSRVNPFVSTTVSLSRALDYAGYSRNAYISIIVPVIHEFRTTDFRRSLSVGESASNQEVGLPGVIFPGEILAQVPSDVARAEEHRALRDTKSTLTWLSANGSRYLSRIDEQALHQGPACPSCKKSMPTYFLAQLGSLSEKLVTAQFDDCHAHNPFHWRLALARGAAAKCICGSMWFNQEIDELDHVVFGQHEHRGDYIAVDIENRSNSSIAVLWVWFSSASDETRVVRKFSLWPRKAEILARRSTYSVPTPTEIDEANALLRLSDRRILPGVTHQYGLQADPERAQFGVFGAFFTSGHCWIPLRRRAEAKWDLYDVDEI